MNGNSDPQQDPVLEFMESPIVQWIQLLVNKETMEIEELLDGVILNQIMLKIDPRPTNKKAHKNARNDVNLNVQNLMMLIQHIKSYYEEIRKQVIVMPLPKVIFMVKNIRTPEGLAEMKKLLLLVLGCAVQCDNREEFILKMKELTYQGMETMMNHIKYITEDSENVLNLQWEDFAELPDIELENLTRKLAYHIQKLVTERDDQYLTSTNLTLERDYYLVQFGSSSGNLSRRESFSASASRQQLMVELNEIRLKLRKAKQELDEKVEQNTDLKQECDDLHQLLQEMRKENSELLADARSVRTMRDENDILKEKAFKASRLENEVDMLKDKVKDIEFYKQRVSEIREDNKLLHETKDMLEDQLETLRSRLDGLVDAEKKIIDLKRQLQDLSEERERDRLQIEELMESNSKLEMDKQQSMDESGNLAYQLEQARSREGGRMSIRAESEESAHTRALRLEKENKHLLALINTYKDSIKSSELTQAGMVELEKENKRLSHRNQQLQEHINKEKQSVLDFEQLSNELAAERKRLETTLETSRSTSERRIQELEQETAQLQKTVDSLRERTKIEGDAKIKAIEKENKVLSELIKDLTSKLHKSEYECKNSKQQLEDMKDNIQQAETTHMENAKLERQNVNLAKTVKQLELASSNMADLEQRSSDLAVENKQLSRQVEALKRLNEQLQEVEQDKNVTEQEATRLKRQVESLKRSCERMTELEQDKLESDKRVTQLQQSLDTMKASLKHKEKVEIVQIELENELDRVRSQLETTKKRLNNKEEEMFELERKSEQTTAALNQTNLRIKKLTRFEQENKELVSENSKLETGSKKLIGEVQRLKKSLAEKSTHFDELNENFEELHRQNKILSAQVDELQNSLTASSGSEEQYRTLQKQANVEKRALNALREELVNEKLISQQLQSKLDRIETELEDLGINKEELLKHGWNGDSDQRFKALESKLESTLQKSLSAKEEKIASLESRLQESVNLNNKLRSDIKNIKRDYEALSQRHHEEGLASDSMPADSATTEIFKIKDHLISVERKNATLLADNAALRSSSQNLESHVSSLQSQIGSLQRQNEKNQETNDSLQKQCAKLQVENSTLQSQCSSLMLQNAQSTTLQSNIESEKKDLAEAVAELQQEKEELEKAHDDMQALYERQTMELESLTQDHQRLKQRNKQITQDQRDLENKFGELLRKNSEVNKQRMNETTLQSGNFEALKEAHDKLNRSYKNLNNEYEDLQSDHRSLKTSYNQMKLQYAKLEAESSDIKDHNQQLDIAASRLNNRCEVLMQLKLNLEEENRHLLEQIGRLMSQNEELLSQTLESKDQIYAEQKQYTERMQEIRRQKEKLEEKIMDIYRTPGQSPHKRTRGLGGTLRKAFQNLKGSDNRRKRDGLPPHGSNSNISNHSDQGSGSFKRSASPNADDSTNLPRQDSGSLDSNNLNVPEVPRKNSVEKESKRRSKLGAMTYSTSAINQLSLQSANLDLRKSTTALKEPKQHRGSSFSSDHHRSSSGSNTEITPSDGKTSDGTSMGSHDQDGADVSMEKQSASVHYQNSDKFREEVSLGPTGRSDSNVVMRSHPSSSHQRPLSVHSSSKPTSSVMPVPNVPSRSSSTLTAAQRLDSLIGSPRGSREPGGSPRSYNSTDMVVLRSKSSTGQPRRPVSAVTPANSGYVMQARPYYRLPLDSSGLPREMTSTPISSRGVDIATVSPILSTSSSNPIRKDIPPPDATPSPTAPIRRDIPPDPSSFGVKPRRVRSQHDANHLTSLSETAAPYQQRRPPTPKKEMPSDSSDKNTQWYEYGCV